MSLELKDVRVKLDAETHRMLSLLADAKDREISDMAREIIERAVHGELHAVRIAAQKMERLGLTGNGRDFRGKHEK